MQNFLKNHLVFQHASTLEEGMMIRAIENLKFKPDLGLSTLKFKPDLGLSTTQYFLRNLVLR